MSIPRKQAEGSANLADFAAAVGGLIRESGVTESGDGYMMFGSGVQVCFGTYKHVMGSVARSQFARSFLAGTVPSVVCSASHPGINGQLSTIRLTTVGEISNDSFTVLGLSFNSSNQPNTQTAVSGSYIAFGVWK